MATEAVISDLISPMEKEVKDEEHNSGNSRIGSEELVGVNEKVESSSIQLQEAGTNLDQKVKPAFEPTRFQQGITLDSVKVKDVLDKKKEDTLTTEAALSQQDSKQTSPKGEDENNGAAEKAAVRETSGDDLSVTSPLVEEVQMIGEKLNQVPISETDGQVLEVSEGTADKQENKVSDENANDQLIKEESFQEFKEPIEKNKGETIEELRNEITFDPETECKSEDMGNYIQENESVAKIGEEEVLDEPSKPKAPENEITDVSILACQAPTEEIYEEKVEEAKECVEKADIVQPKVTKAISLTEVKLSDKPLEEASIVRSPSPEHETEKENLENIKSLDAESESKVQNVQETSPNESAADEIKNIIKQVPNELSEALDQDAEEVSENKGAANLESMTPPNFHGAEETIEIQARIVEQVPTKPDIEKLVPIPETWNTVHKIKDKIADKTGSELMNTYVDDEITNETEKVSEPKDQGAKDDTVTPLEATEVTSSKEFQLNDEPVNVRDSSSRAESIETTEKDDTIQQDGEIEKVISEHTSHIVSDHVHENEAKDSKGVNVDDDVGVSNTPVTVIDAGETDLSSAVDEGIMNEIAKVIEEVPEELPEAINENIEADSNFVPDQENGTRINEDTAYSFETDTTQNIVPRELEIAMSDVTVQDTENRLREKEIHEENIEQKTKCDEGTDTVLIAGVEETLLEDNKLINERGKAFLTSSESTSPEMTETVDTSKKDLEVSGVKLEEPSTVESKLLAYENETAACEIEAAEKTDSGKVEVENAEVPVAESESLVHNFEEVSSPEVKSQVFEAGRSDEISLGEKIQAYEKIEQLPESSFVSPSSEESHKSEEIKIENTGDGNMKKDDTKENNLKLQEDSGVVSQLQNNETVEETNAAVQKAELEEEYQDSSSTLLPEKEFQDSSPEAVLDDKAYEKPLPTGELEEEYQDSSSALLFEKQYEIEQSKVSETSKHSNVLDVEEVHETEAIAAVDKTHADEVEDETKEALETIPEPKTVDQEVLYDQTFPLKSVEGAKGVEETDITPTVASSVTSSEEIKPSDKAVKHFDICSDFKTPEATETIDNCQRGSEVESIKPEEASTVEPKLAEHESKIEVHGTVLADEVDGVGQDLGMGETNTNESEVVREVPKPLFEGLNQGPEANVVAKDASVLKTQVENIEKEIQNSFSVISLSEESHEDELRTFENTDDILKQQETSGILSQLQNIEAEEKSDADEAKAEEANDFDAICESKDYLEEIHETKTSPSEEISDEVKMEEETNNVADKISDFEAVVGDVPADESTGVSKCSIKNTETAANINHTAADKTIEAIAPQSVIQSRVLGVEKRYEPETSPTVQKTHFEATDNETATVLGTTSKPDCEDIAEILGRNICTQASDTSSDSKTPKTTQTGDEKKAHESAVLSVQNIHETSTHQTVGESDAYGSVNVSDVEENKSHSSFAEPKNQAVEDIQETGTSPTVGEIDINGVEQEAPEVLIKKINQDVGAASKEEIAPSQSIEAQKTKEQEEKGYGPIPKSKDQSSDEDHNTKTIPATDKIEQNGTKVLEKKTGGTNTGVEDFFDRQPQARNTGFEPIYQGVGDTSLPIVEDGMMVKAEGINKNNALLNENVTNSSKAGSPLEESLYKPVDGFKEIEKALQPDSDIHDSQVEPTPMVAHIVNKQLDEAIQNLKEVESETHEIPLKELLTEEPEMAEENSTLKEATTADIYGEIASTMGTANVNDGEEEKDTTYVEKETIAENEYEILATEATRSIKEVKSPEVTLGNQAEVKKMEHVAEAEENGTNESMVIYKKEATENASNISSSITTSLEELTDKGEIREDEKRDFVLDPITVIPSVEGQVEKQVMLPTTNNQKAVEDVNETIETKKEPQEQEKTSLSLSHAQIAKKEYQNGENKNTTAITSRDFQVKPENPNAAKQVEYFEEEKLGEGSPETINNPAEVSSSEILHKPNDQTNQANEEPKTEAEEGSLAEEEKADEGEDNENKKADSVSDAPVMVEPSRDIYVKTPHKKSHNILSGVGSKVKHSISKVKKAITGKSSHQKTSFPKEDKKNEAVLLL